MMRDDFLSADWARSHGHTTEAIAGFFTTLAASFATLQDHQFDAPWRHDVTRSPRCPR